MKEQSLCARKKVLADGKTKDVFFQKDIMEKAMLKQPVIVRIANQIGMKENTLDIKKVAKFVADNRG